MIAFLSDIHANREALSACLGHADRAGAKRYVFLGDYVGYGADPAWCLRTLRARIADGAIAILGNHDQAIFQRGGGMSGRAAAAIAWTREQLSPDDAAFLQTLPLEYAEEDRLYVHADASAPEEWRYVFSAEEARRSLEATPARVTICGHVHVPRLFGLTATDKVSAFSPANGVPVPLAPARRWLAVMGSVGQPRDGDPSACYALLDPETAELRWMRVPYDVETAAAKIRRAGLPESLATRLFTGT
ncbi:metallophosphoesterase family protein [Roseomonas xinghualingensis]|uniref:metallophosphoesterase family protein n=1 Tax=Roseomonas xinghualingensis TaxID=2986475 RepID=UPI0021F1DFB2|nr:metallophosphoesterase family protein [Roseomonas sp. SXEYE001]MCV4209516.1 metallophosphatase family protein [Roseomonas sp. SXEYE001]